MRRSRGWYGRLRNLDGKLSISDFSASSSASCTVCPMEGLPLSNGRSPVERFRGCRESQLSRGSHRRLGVPFGAKISLEKRRGLLRSPSLFDEDPSPQAYETFR